MSISPRELVAGTVEIASLPEVFLRVNEMIDSPRYSAADIGKVIGQDPALSARLLKIVNSAFYGFPSQIDTISRAITIVGTRELRELILATSVIKVFKGIPNDLINMDEFWAHSICAGLAARALAAERGERVVERFFVSGLLHDIGALLIYAKLPELAREALLRSHHHGLPLQVAEQEVMSFDHAAVGLEILRKWKLPEHLQEVVACHHNPSRSLNFPRDTALIHLADAIADVMNKGTSGEERVRPLDAQAWQLAGLDENCLSTIIEETEKRFQDTLELIQPSPSKVASIH
ncbi:MAG TPA: HDOD domain-containing protein [Gammaproteobacteria bacterium]|nr:HDOD domain-containing protein [Gammaproteobacteria bacterium]